MLPPPPRERQKRKTGYGGKKRTDQKRVIVVSPYFPTPSYDPDKVVVVVQPRRSDVTYNPNLIKDPSSKQENPNLLNSSSASVSGSSNLGHLDEMLANFAYGGSKAIPSKPLHHKSKASSSRNYIYDHDTGRVISPYFQKKVNPVPFDEKDQCFVPYLDKNEQELGSHRMRRGCKNELEQPVGNNSQENQLVNNKRKRAGKASVVSPHFSNPEFKEVQEDIETQSKRGTTNKTICKTKKDSRPLTAAEKCKKAYERKTPNNDWVPPVSPHRLIQEDHYEDPWRVVVICMLLNRTSGDQVKRVITDFFELFPDPKAALDVTAKEIEETIKTLGLQKKKSIDIQRFSSEYLFNDWTRIHELHGVGRYAADAYAIFCTGEWQDVTPDDHKLTDYWEYLKFLKNHTEKAGLAEVGDRVAP